MTTSFTDTKEYVMSILNMLFLFGVKHLYEYFMNSIIAGFPEARLNQTKSIFFLTIK